MMKNFFGKLAKGIAGGVLLLPLLGASCIKQPDGTYSLRIDDETIGNALKGKPNRWDASESKNDGTIILEGCWSGPGTASDSESGFITPDFQWFPTYELAKTEAQRNELMDACVAYGSEDRCCRVTLEGAIRNGKYEIRRFIKAEQIR